MTDNSSRKRDPLAMPTPVIDVNDDHWLVREMKYWEQTAERLRTQSQELQKSHDTWKSSHEAVLKQVQQWETWYKSLEKDRDLYKQWDADKKAEIERLANESRHLVEVVRQWEEWYKSLEADRDRKDAEIRELRGWIDALHRNPFRYLREFFGELFKPKK